MPDNAGGLVYGTILVATLLSAESARSETYLKTVGAVVVTLLAYWVTISYSEFAGERLERGEHFRYAASSERPPTSCRCSTAPPSRCSYCSCSGRPARR